MIKLFSILPLKTLLAKLTGRYVVPAITISKDKGKGVLFTDRRDFYIMDDPELESYNARYAATYL
jgi:hypothetical protein